MFATTEPFQSVLWDTRERRELEGAEEDMLATVSWPRFICGDRCVCRPDIGEVGIGGHSSFPGGFIEIRSRCYKIHLLK